MNFKSKDIIDEMFRDHHDCVGMDEEEIEDLIDESTIKQRYDWLKKVGYDVEGNYD